MTLNVKNRKRFALLAIGLLLANTLSSTLAYGFMCGGEEFTRKYLPEAEPITSVDSGKQYIGFPMEKVGELLALDCDLQRANKKLSLYANQVSTLESLLIDKEEQLELYESKYYSLISDVTRLENENIELQNELDKIAVTDGDQPKFWSIIKYVSIGFLFGGAAGLTTGVMIRR